MSDLDRSLRETLSSGASRILNVAEVSRKVRDEAAAAGVEKPDLLFSHRALNNSVFIKRPKEAMTPTGGQVATTAEILENGEVRTITVSAPAARVEKGDIATILYVPFDADDIPGGGNAIDLSNRRRGDALMELLGFDIRGQGAGEKRDSTLLGILEQLPSLDPFLLRDKLEAEGISAPDAYFDISDEEFAEIKRYILTKFRPITARVLDQNRADFDQLTEQFIMKLWEAKDLQYLAPITQVFRIDPSQASEIYYSWKGVTYYEWQYKRGQRPLLAFVEWMARNAVPSHYVGQATRDELERSARIVTETVARHLKNSSEILRIYNSAYDDLFVKGGNPKPFIDFLRDSSTLFWDISASISALNHGVSVWRQRTKNASDGRLAADELAQLLDILDRVIV